MITPEQPSLLSYSEQKAARFSSYANVQPNLVLTASELTVWKQRILQFQQQVRQSSPTTQGVLFASVRPNQPIDDDVDPFTLPQENIDFWRQSVTDVGTSALYFVIDHTEPILLYVGETIKSNQRWKGVHDCKRYVSHYLTTHNQLNLQTTVNIGFWRNAPSDRKARQQLERRLIHQWRSPFNKENWDFWGTPFAGKRPPNTGQTGLYSSHPDD
ncbi:MAG: GIY-YIG nuclease family protein [Cyanobacteria bacterium J06659_2]